MPTTLATPSQLPRSGGDQARGLRALAALRKTSSETSPSLTRGCHTIVVSGGKGGVGRSVIALNLAITLAQRGAAVGLLDASPDLGNIELLCGLNGYWNLSHVVQGSRRLNEVILAGPAGIHIVSGASALTTHHEGAASISHSILDQLLEFEQQLDWLIVDASGGTSSLTRNFASVADDLLIIATPEPTGVAEAYATVKSFTTAGHPRLGLLVNQADSTLQAQQILDHLQQAAHSFLQVDLHRRGFIPRDASVPTSVNERVPFVLRSPDSPATLALRQLTQRWNRPQPPEGVARFFSRLQQYGKTLSERTTVRN